MRYEKIILVSLGVSLLALPFLHALVSRMVKGFSPQPLALLLVLGGNVVYWFWLAAVMPSYQAPGSIAGTAYAVIVHASFSLVYFHLFNMSETARRIRILFEVARAGKVPVPLFEQLYKTSDIVTIRLDRLVALHQLSVRDGRYALDGRLLYFAAVLVLGWRRLLGITKQ